MKGKNNIPNRRRHKRKDEMNTIEYVIEPLTTNETFDGVLVNVSESGLCILTNDILNKGQQIRITANGHAINKSAVVRWTEKYDDFYYKVGLELL
ncbi:MAG: PilZ domain-containing protein [Nitrospira sp.]|nr:PilZ domain-containing protein [Nitrospira sp.]